MGRWGPGRRWRARIRGGPQRLLGENNWRFFQREQSLSGKRVKGGKEPTNCAPPPYLAPTPGRRHVGWELLPGAPTGTPLCLSVPFPAALLSFCTSAGNVPLTYIFFQTYVTFFFPPLWEETGENPRKEKLERRTRKQGAFHHGSRKRPTEEMHIVPGSRELLFDILRVFETESGDQVPGRGPEP